MKIKWRIWILGVVFSGGMWLPAARAAAPDAAGTPAGGYTPDMINYANSVDCYGIWADMVVGRAPEQPLDGPHYFCVYAGRRDGKAYRLSHNDILGRYGRAIVMADRMPKALSPDMGDQMYTACFETEAEKDAFIRDIQELAPAPEKPAAAAAPAKKTKARTKRKGTEQ